MNVDQLKGLWKQLRGEAKSRWGKLTDDDWKVVEGDAEKLAGKIQERYGHTKEAAQAEIDKLTAAYAAQPKEPERTAIPHNGDQLLGRWKQLHGELKRRWGKLTDDDLAVAAGDAEKLAGRIQERYGKTKEAAKQEIDRLLQTLK